MNAHYGTISKRKKSMKLSILTPTIPSRENQVKALSEKLAKQIGDLPVEHLILSDNRKRPIGAKRQSLVEIARGEYFAFVDDDDDVTDDYVAELMNAIQIGADVITFRQKATYNQYVSEVHFGINNQDMGFNPGGITLRAPWHICAWKRQKVKHCQFGECNHGEDRIWSTQARKCIKTATHIDKVIQIYDHQTETTAAPEVDERFIAK